MTPVLPLIAMLLTANLATVSAAEGPQLRYGNSFAVEVKRKGLSLADLQKKVLQIRKSDDLATIPTTPIRDLHENNRDGLHRFVLIDDGLGERVLVVDLEVASSPRAVSFVLLTLDGTVKAAGLLGKGMEGKRVKYLLSNRSRRFCTTYEQLLLVKDFLGNLGVNEKDFIIKRGKPLSCENVLTRQEKMIKKFEKGSSGDD